jgi:DnaJ-class molecular chaperone
MVKLVPVVCPQCGAGLQIPGDLKKAYCVYCGAQIVFEKEVEKTRPCPACGGAGKCLPRATSGKMVPTCHGTGRCAACEGTGKIGNLPCDLCKGSGKCSSCGGTGKCLRCGGSGRIVSWRPECALLFFARTLILECKGRQEVVRWLST